MRRIMNQKLISIFVAIAVGMAAVFVVFGIVITNSAKGVFQKDGYILGEVFADEGSSNSIYFDANSKYKSKYPNKIALKGEDGKSTITKYSFVHYSNNDLSSFAKGVFVNLDELNNENLNYYNIPAEALVKNSGKTYAFKVSTKEQRMSNFLWKIEENKYMVVGSGVNVHFAEGRDKALEGYVEFEYKDKGVVQLTHRDGTYQTISSDACITLDNGAVIMLNDRSVYVGEDKKLSLDQMVINSDDNIKVDEEEEEKDKTSVNNTTNNNSTVISGGGTSGGGGTTPGETINFPSFAVTSLEPGLVSVAAQIEITDDDDLLGESGVRVSIVERGTNKTVWQKDVQKGQYQIMVNTDGLTPNKEYLLVANADYEYKGEKYNKDFVSQLFRTNSTGISMKTVRVDSTSIKLNITEKNFSEITTANIKLIDKKSGEAIRTENINLAAIKGDEDGLEYPFTNLTSNTEYSVVLTDFYTGASVLPEENNIEKEYTTLKESPTLGLPQVTINKVGKAFSLYLKNEGGDPVVDPDDGIEKMVFEIYEASQVTTEEIKGDPVYTAESKKTSGVSVKLDDTNLKRNVKYVYRVVAIFNDNEKIVEFNTDFSSLFTMTSAAYPSIIFTPQDVEDEQHHIIKEGVEHDSFRGVVVIQDEADVVVRPNQITYSITGNDGGIVQMKQWDVSAYGELSTPIEITGLRSDTTYTVTFTGMADLDDGNDPMRIYLGSFQVTTKEKPDAVMAEVKTPKTSAEMSRQYAFNAKVLLGSTYENESGKVINPAYEMSTMNNVQLVMYNGIKDESGNITKGAEWARKTISNTATSVDPVNYTYNSTLKSLFSKDTTPQFEITPSTFGMTNAQVTSDVYVLEVRNAQDYTDFGNQIDIIGENNTVAEFIIPKHGFVPNLPANVNDAINVTEILFGDMQEEAGKTKYKTIASSGAADSSLGLKSDTIVGYSVKALSYPSNALKYAKKVTYKMYKLSKYISDSEVELKEENLVASTTINVPSEASSLPTWEVPVKAGSDVERGNLYVFTYEVELDLAEGGSEPITAKYPRDSVGATSSTVLRSVICPCPKESPSMYMYLKSALSSGTQYNMTFRYKYTDADGAYIVDPNNIDNPENDFVIKNGSTTKKYKWNEDASSGGGIKNISLTGINGKNNSLAICKKVSHYNPIENYSAAITEEEYVDQPMLFEKNTESAIQGLKFHTDVDVSNLKIELDSDSTTAAQLAKIAAVKVTLNCEGQEKVFDYLTLDDNNVAYIPLVRITEFKKKTITVSLQVYYENNEIGTDIVQSDNKQQPVILSKYSRANGYVYYNDSIKDSLYLVQKDLSDTILTDKLTQVKTFTVNKLKNVNAEETYTKDAEEELSYTLDSQGLDTNLTGNNYNIDSYYIMRRVDVTELSPVTSGANVVSFSIIRPVVKNVRVQTGVTDATVIFDFVGNGKSTLKNNKLYLVVRDSQSPTYDVTDPQNTYEIQLSSSTDKKDITVAIGDAGHAALQPGKTYYFTVYAEFEDGEPSEKLRLVTETGEQFEDQIITLGDVGFSKITYAYESLAYETKNLKFNYTTNVVSGFHIVYSLYDITRGEQIDITGYDDYTDVLPSTEMRLPVGNQGTAIPGRSNLVYGNKYKLVARALTKSTGEQVGYKEVTFTLAKLNNPAITSIMSAKKSGNKNYIDVKLVTRDAKFATVGQQVRVKFYEGRHLATTTTEPIKEITVDLTDKTTYKLLTLGYDEGDPILKKDTEYTMVVEADVDGDYSGHNIVTMKEAFYVRTLSESGIGYSDVFVKSNDAGDVIIEFYDVERFHLVGSLDYTIFANTSSKVKPISGTIEASSFVPFGLDNVSRRVTIHAGLEVHDRYSISMQLISKDGSSTVLADENKSFSY